MALYNFPHLIGAIGKRCDTSYQFAITSCHLFPVGEIPGAGNIACIDSISDNDVKSVFCGSGAETPCSPLIMRMLIYWNVIDLHGITRIKKTLSTLHR
jgi:hypothetical protein